jgi:hypothetical protein
MADWGKGDVNDTAVVDESGEEEDGETMAVFEIRVDERGRNDEVIGRGE